MDNTPTKAETLTGHCHGCGKLFDCSLLDAKPDDPKNPDNCEWNKLYCKPCYGDGFNEM